MTERIRLSGRISHLAGALSVRRLLPAALKRAVGPFVFFDHFGPITLGADVDSDIGAHPHIGLATVSYLFEGSLLHRDSLGTVQLITPGAINWMTAGRGIVHSERTCDAERGQSRRLHGLQLWVALPPEQEEMPPAFQHVSADDIPLYETPDGVKIRILVGKALGMQSPVCSVSETLYLDICLPAGKTWILPSLADEMALYSPEHPLILDGELCPSQQMTVLPFQTGATLQAGEEAVRVIVIGGAPLMQPIDMWWNFVSSDRQRIVQAAKRWEANNFDHIAGETARIPAPKLPE